MRGRIKSFARARGYGFIEGEKGDIFFHVSQCREYKPIVGDTVLFDLKETPKGARASRIRSEKREYERNN